MTDKYVLKDMVKGVATFDYYRDGCLFYKTANGVLFPVDLEDAAGATFNAQEKGILLMRWMRKFVEGLSREVGLEAAIL